MKLESKIASKIISELNKIPKFTKKKTVYIRDTMAVIQSMNPEAGKTFNRVADTFMHGVMKVYEHADTVIDVFDHYDNMSSVKAME